MFLCVNKKLQKISWGARTSPMKSTNLRMPPEVYEQITALSDGTNVPLNTAILLCMKGIFEIINADPHGIPPTPLIVELGRVARQRAGVKAKHDANVAKLEQDVRGWEADRDAIFKAARAENAGSELVAVLKAMDAKMKENRRYLDNLNKDR